jgi:glycosyltransferase involved in cell wall biosynthesis
MDLKIGFVSTRFSGTDGVSLEAGKWHHVMTRRGHACFWFGGEVDRDPNVSMQVPEAHFKNDHIQWINRRVFNGTKRHPSVTEAIHNTRYLLKQKLHEFISRFEINLMVVENALSIPMNVPLGLAITETISETCLPTIAHHHDFYWERTRYTSHAVGDYLKMAFPPDLPSIAHVVINTAARQALAHRLGISATVIPNVIEFEQPPCFERQRADRIKEALGLLPTDRIILQPTRIVRRKGIEMAIDLVRGLQDPDCKLVISHQGGDEGHDYESWLHEYAKANRVDMRILGPAVKSPWTWSSGEPDRISLWDVYSVADLVTFPSRNEGFGNALLEAIYFRRPILVNRYANFIRDIEPCGLDLVTVNGFINDQALEDVRQLLRTTARRQQMTEQNYSAAARHFSYTLLEKKLTELMGDLTVHLKNRSCPDGQRPSKFVRLAN